MDNASKALIMAGAILISLALVGLGVYIFSISSDLQNNAGATMDAMSAQTTNKQITAYAGTKVRGSNVTALFSMVDTLNVQEVFPVELRYGEPVNHTWSATVNTTLLNSGDNIRESAYYEVVMQDQLARDGYVDTISIRQY